LVLVPLVLGVDRFVNERYVPSVAATLRVKQSLGVLGGKPGSSLYLVGAQEHRLFYLDPHTVFPFITHVSNDAAPLPATSAERNDARDGTYACDDALHMDARELDPSMVLGFYCRTRGDLDELCLELELLQRRAGAAPLITVASARDLSNGASRVWKPVGAKTRAAPEPTRGSQSELSRAESEEETEARGAESEDDEWEFL
jgi:cysteine protease ATG4